jgi:hypothetical protein
VVHVESQGEAQGVGFAFEDYSLKLSRRRHHADRPKL